MSQLGRWMTDANKLQYFTTYLSVEDIRASKRDGDWISHVQMTGDAPELWATVQSEVGCLSWIPKQVDYLELYDSSTAKSKRVTVQEFLNLLEEEKVPYKLLDEKIKELKFQDGKFQDVVLLAPYIFIPNLEFIWLDDHVCIRELHRAPKFSMSDNSELESMKFKETK